MATLASGAKVALRGFREPYGSKLIVGELKAEAQMTCRRCLKPVTVVLESSIRWGLVFSESEMQDLEKDMDPILVEEGQIPLRQAIEDEWFYCYRSCQHMNRVRVNGYRIRNPWIFPKIRAHLRCSLR